MHLCELRLYAGTSVCRTVPSNIEKLQWLVQKQPVLRILDHPGESVVEVFSGHGTGR